MHQVILTYLGYSILSLYVSEMSELKHKTNILNKPKIIDKNNVTYKRIVYLGSSWHNILIHDVHNSGKDKQNV